MAGTQRVYAEFGTVKLMIGLLLQLVANAVQTPTPASNSFVESVGDIADALVAYVPSSGALDVLGQFSRSQPSRERALNAFVGLLKIHPDDSQSTEWAHQSPVGVSEISDLLLRLALDEALRTLSEPGRALLAKTYVASVLSVQTDPEILERGRILFMGHALTMATAARFS